MFSEQCHGKKPRVVWNYRGGAFGAIWALRNGFEEMKTGQGFKGYGGINQLTKSKEFQEEGITQREAKTHTIVG